MNPTDMGMNKTGGAMSPKQTKDMADMAARDLSRVPPGDERALMDARRSYANGEPVGTMPPPASVKGAVKTVGKMIAGKKPTTFLDKLGQRLAFERTGARLYEAMIAKVASMGGDGVGLDEGELRRIQSEEIQHMRILSDAIGKLGADPTVMTPCADVSGVEAIGLLQVLTDPRTSVTQCLDAILVAELADNASWELLIELCNAFGQDELVETFTRALRQENEHLATVRRWLTQLTMQEAQLGA